MNPSPVFAFKNARAWERWLSGHHRKVPGVWLKLAKTGSGIASVTYAEAVEAAIVWGWIDGQRRSHDGTWFLQRFTPRGPRSIWSKLNREKALALIASGRMKASGLAEVKRAQADGRWKAAYASPRRMRVPLDLAAALAARPRAASFFATLNARNRYAVLFRIQTAQRPDTRAKRLRQLVQMLSRKEKLYP
jgi:uncharacterized protein YdeI (YjbR/CyaY-like superfamily)